MSPTAIPGNLILQSPTANDPLLDLNTQPSLDLQFATSKTLDDAVSGTNLITFSRASSGTYVGSDGLIKTSPVNLFTDSEQFDQGWAKKSLSISANVSASPDGALNADQVTVNSDNNYAYISQSKSINSGSTNTVSVWAKYVNSQYIWLLGGVNPDVFAYFDLINGTVGSTNGYNCTITSNGNGWYRCSATITKTDATSNEEVGFGLTRTDNNPIDNAVGDSVYIWGAQLEEGSTATTYIPTTTTISGAPRFDHDPVTGESLGLLIEESRTNYFTNSTPTSTGWAQYNGSSITDNQATGPNGVTNSASLVTFPVTGGAIPIIGASSAGVSGTVTVSMYVRAVTGTVSLQIGTNVAYGTTQIVGTSWTRIQFTTSSLGSSAGLRSGDVNSVQNFYVWGAQVEVGSFPTSYIPTTGSTVTRAADVASITGTNFSSWYNQSEGTVYITYQNRNVSTPFSAAKFNDGTGLNIITPVNNSNNATIITAGVIVFSETTSANVYLQTLKRALAFEENNTRLAANGTLVGAVDTSVTIPVVNKVDIGTGTAGAIARLAYFPYRLADATLQEITS